MFASCKFLFGVTQWMVRWSQLGHSDRLHMAFIEISNTNKLNPKCNKKKLQFFWTEQKKEKKRVLISFQKDIIHIIGN